MGGYLGSTIPRGYVTLANRVRGVAKIAVVCGGLVVTAVIGIAWVLLHAPVTFDNVWGFAPEGQAFTKPLGSFQHVTAWHRDSFVAAFRTALAVAWTAWTVLLLSASRIEVNISARVARLAVLSTSALVAICFPPTLSGDVLGYVAYGRVVGLYGLNPYLHGRQALGDLGDPAATFLVWNTPLPYGPLWVLLSAAVARVGDAAGGLWLEVFLHKAVAALALVVAAVAGAHVSERQRPGTNSLALIVIGLNPLLLIEGPGTGHNDVVMTSFLVIAASLSARRRHDAAALMAGLAAAVKPVALAALPLLMAKLWGVGIKKRQLLRIAALLLVPTVVLSYAFGGPGVFIESVVHRATADQSHRPITLAVALCAAGVLAFAHLRQAAAEPVMGAWLVAWIPAALVLGVIVMPVHFPWYITWALLPALTRLDRRGLPYLAVAVVVGVSLMWQYTVHV